MKIFTRKKSPYQHLSNDIDSTNSKNSPILANNTNYRKPKNGFFIKSLRTDELIFFNIFINSITRSPLQQKKPAIRTGQKLAFTMHMMGVDRRATKPAQFTKEQKQYFSYIQPTSYGFEGHHPLVFKSSLSSNKKVCIGVVIDEKDALINRMMLNDMGTISRPFEFKTLNDAQSSYNKQLNKIFFNNKESFKNALLAKAKSPHSNSMHNEVLARIRWNTDSSSMVFIGDDNIESRLAAINLANRIRHRLVEQAKEFGQVLDEKYEIPICFYLPGSNKHFQLYDIFEQVNDKLQAKRSFQLNIALRNFSDHKPILACDPDGMVQYKIDHPKIYLITMLLQNKCLHIVSYIIENAKEDVLNRIQFSQVEKICLSTIFPTVVVANEQKIAKFLIDKGVSINAQAMTDDKKLTTIVEIARNKGEFSFAYYLAVNGDNKFSKQWMELVHSISSCPTKEARSEKYKQLKNEHAVTLIDLYKILKIESTFRDKDKFTSLIEAANDDLASMFRDQNKMISLAKEKYWFFIKIYLQTAFLSSAQSFNFDINGLMKIVIKSPENRDVIEVLQTLVSIAYQQQITIDRFKLIQIAKENNPSCIPLLFIDLSNNIDVSRFRELFKDQTNISKKSQKELLLETALRLVNHTSNEREIEEIKQVIEDNKKNLFADQSIPYGCRFFKEKKSSLNDFELFESACMEKLTQIKDNHNVI